MERIIKFNFIVITIFLFCFQYSSAQVPNLTLERKLRHTRFLSVARSSFDVNGLPSSPSYSSLEFRLGAGLVKPISKYIELKSGINLGLKVKRKSYFFGPSKQYSNEPWVILNLDEAASNRSHLFAEIPLTLQFTPPKSRIGLIGGLNFRFWAPNDDSVDVLTARQEIGIIGGISYNLIKRINIGFEHYYGLTDIWGGDYYGSNSQLMRFHVRNQFTQLTIQQTF